MAALETEVRELTTRVRGTEKDAAAARVLAGGADRDVTEMIMEIRDFRQDTMSRFNAMREDLTDLRQLVDNGFAELRTGFAELGGNLDANVASLRHITDLVNTISAQLKPVSGSR